MLYVTSNKEKIKTARKYFKLLGVKLVVKPFDFIEIQGSVEEIALDKATQAFKHFKKPLFVTDYDWAIPRLGGFPGAYMAQVNNWFTPEDFLKLVKPGDKIVKIGILCYIGPKEMKLFKEGKIGTFKELPSGSGTSIDQVVEFPDIEPTIWKRFIDYLREDDLICRTHNGKN